MKIAIRAALCLTILCSALRAAMLAKDDFVFALIHASFAMLCAGALAVLDDGEP